jgi:hypothetical protein
VRLLPALLLIACTSAPDPAPSPSAPTPAPAAEPASPSATPLQLEAHRRLSAGYGCGGNCATNTRGDSRVAVTITGDLLSAADTGEIEIVHSSPESLDTQKRTWSFQWHGQVSRSKDAMRWTLTGDARTCAENLEHGSVLGKPGPCQYPPPATMTIACARGQVEADGANRPVWLCDADPALPPREWSGSEFPWVFGIDAPVDTVRAGEPMPRTHYELRR